jgi:hypothetical protein
MAYAEQTTGFSAPNSESSAALSAPLCDSCAHQQIVRNTRGSVFSLCRRSRDEPDRFPRYPRLPVLQCPGYERDSHKPADGSDQGNAAP